MKTKDIVIGKIYKETGRNVKVKVVAFDKQFDPILKIIDDPFKCYITVPMCKTYSGTTILNCIPILLDDFLENFEIDCHSEMSDALDDIGLGGLA